MLETAAAAVAASVRKTNYATSLKEWCFVFINHLKMMGYGKCVCGERANLLVRTRQPSEVCHCDGRESGAIVNVLVPQHSTHTTHKNIKKCENMWHWLMIMVKHWLWVKMSFLTTNRFDKHNRERERERMSIHIALHWSLFGFSFMR